MNNYQNLESKTIKNTVKIAVLCNMNNNHFSLVRYLRDRGLNAELLLTDNEIAHFAPSADCYNDDWRKFTVQLTWGSEKNLLKVRTKQVISDLKHYDIIIASGFIPAYLTLTERNIDIFSPYGGDVWDANYNRLKRDLWFPIRYVLAYLHRRGLAECNVINSTVSPLLEKLYEKFFPHSERWTVGLPMVHIPTYHESVVYSSSNWLSTIANIRKETDFLFVYHSRHQMGNDENPSVKRPDRMIDGVHRFAHKNPKVNFKVITYEYGQHVAYSKEKIRTLGLEERFIWYPESQRKDIIPVLMQSDLIFGQFNESVYANGVLQEALTAAKPILTHIDITKHPAIDLYPAYSAKEPNEIAARLEEFIANPEKGYQMGIQAKKWYVSMNNTIIDTYVSYIKQKARQLNLDFAR